MCACWTQYLSFWLSLISPALLQFEYSYQGPSLGISVFEEGALANFPKQYQVVEPIFDQMQQDPHDVVPF